MVSSIVDMHDRRDRAIRMAIAGVVASAMRRGPDGFDLRPAGLVCDDRLYMPMVQRCDAGS